MNIPDNLILQYYDTGSLRRVFEVDPEHLPDERILHGINVCWDENGILREECYYYQNLKHGKYTDRYSDGQLWEENYYEHGLLQGPRTLWYGCGSILIKSNYVNDCVHGIYIRYYSDGNIDELDYFLHGVKITPQIKKMVKNIKNITEVEKTQIALQFGIVL